ncbi:ECF-type sigma factor [Rugamonas sp.]|uniref:ECF-type sigma factor n=1 Tax=Rugamonas sp. TaxID=1926287 RepID=UPI0025E8BFDF|nr:ECF-type sigma factor [Rugamonas sp.]
MLTENVENLLPVAAPAREPSQSRDAHDPRFQSMYGQLRSMARARLRRHETFTLLDTTALVHESFLRLARAGGVRSSEEPAFLAYASHVMRSVIVDTARARLAESRGGDVEVVPLDDEIADALSDEPAAAVAQVHQALQALEASDPRLSQVVSLCYFAGMTEQESAICLGVSERTIRRDAERARLLLRALLA